jgi:hypothetical protein
MDARLVYVQYKCGTTEDTVKGEKLVVEHTHSKRRQALAQPAKKLPPTWHTATKACCCSRTCIALPTCSWSVCCCCCRLPVQDESFGCRSQHTRQRLVRNTSPDLFCLGACAQLSS